MADIVIINPRFEVSFWGMEHALPLMGKRANLPAAAREERIIPSGSLAGPAGPLYTGHCYAIGRYFAP